MALGGVREFPARVKCASLCWHTLDAALKQHDDRSRRSHGQHGMTAEKRMARHENEPFIIGRPVEAVMVPSGQSITLQPGVAGFITQALGGSFTLYVEGNLYRLAGSQADAIGKEVVQAPELPPNATEDDVRELAWQQMRGCFDPEIPVNIVDLGLVYECSVSANADGTRDVKVDMTLTAPGLRHGRSAGRGRAREDRGDPDRAARRT